MPIEEAAGEVLQPVGDKPGLGESKGPILTTRNVTLVSYRLDETTSSEDTQAAILTDLYTRFSNTPSFGNYTDINKAIIQGRVAAGTFVLLETKEDMTVVVAKLRPESK